MYSLSQLEAAGGSRAGSTSPPTPGGTPPKDLTQSTEARQSPETLASATMVRPLITKRGGARGGQRNAPPFCAAAGPIPARTLAAQIWAFCAPASRRDRDRWFTP